jgi:tRNA(fMet)-specific endonuclease VapC
MYLLDTNHCSYILSNQPAVISEFYRCLPYGFAVSIITYGELLYMAEKSVQQSENLTAIQTLLNLVDIYLIDPETAAIYSQIKAGLFDQFASKDPSKRRQTRIQDLGFDDNDLWIAATALQFDLILVSADRDFQRMRQVYPLRVESWLGS